MVDLVRTYPVGKIDGSTPVAGEVGEYISATCTSASTTSVANTLIDPTGMTLALTKGSWVIGYDCLVSCSAAAVTTFVQATVYISDASNVYVEQTVRGCGFKSVNAGDNIDFPLSAQTVLNIATNVSYKIRLVCSQSSAAGTARMQSTNFTANISVVPDNNSVLWARRIR